MPGLRSPFAHLLGSAALTFCVGLGCSPASEPSDTAPATLSEVRIPADFTFATTRAVALSVRASAETLGAPAARLEVRNATGHTLVRGTLQAGRTLALDLALPPHERRVEVQVGTRIVRVPVDGDRAELEL